MIIDPKLESSSTYVTDLKLCQVRLHSNAAFPWLVLIPKHNVVEIIDLNADDQRLLIEDIAKASSVLRQLFAPDKLNVLSLGNIVSQLHLHVIARYKTDPAWPQSAVGSDITMEYDKTTLTQRLNDLKTLFS